MFILMPDGTFAADFTWCARFLLGSADLLILPTHSEMPKQ
jgi:hypothetical protein